MEERGKRGGFLPGQLAAQSPRLAFVDVRRKMQSFLLLLRSALQHGCVMQRAQQLSIKATKTIL